MEGRRPTRLARLLIASLGVGAALLSPIAAAPVAAAVDGLSVTSVSNYTLVPDKSLVHVSIALTAKNTKPDLVRETPSGTITTRYFFESVSIAVHAEATGLKAAAGKTALGAKVTPDDGFAIARINFPSDLYFGQTVTVTVDYDLPGGAPRSDSDIRVGSAFATFYAWAFGDSGDVTISVPGGYEVDASGSPTKESSDGGITTISATGIGDVTDWYTIVVADKADALTQDRLDLAGGEHLVVRAWPEDEEWRTRVRGLLEIGLPVLVDKIGLDWPVDGDIDVVEVHTPLLEGYAGVFYADRHRIEISEELDELTIIHEASHAWFNDDLFTGRWIGEGLADEYASRVLDDVSNGGLGPNPTRKDDAFALNTWGPAGRIADDATDAREQYGYEASWTVMRGLLDEIGEDRMRKALVAAEAKQTAYVGAGPPETIDYTSDWRRFLDLLEEQGGSNGAERLFRDMVVTGAQETTLDERAAARRAYAELVSSGDGWLPGYAVRDPMGRWLFARAEAAIDDATDVLELRDQVDEAAQALGVTPPELLRVAYEGAKDDFGDAVALARRELTTLRALAATDARVEELRHPLTTIGLIGEDPAADLAAAESSFSQGDLDGALAAADALDATLDGASDAGSVRVAIGGLVWVGLLAAGAGAIVVARRRRGSAVAAASAAADAPAPSEPPTQSEPPAPPGSSVPPAPPESPERPEPYATLGDPPSAGSAPDSPVDVGERGDAP
jgi:hypothetical protein